MVWNCDGFTQAGRQASPILFFPSFSASFVSILCHAHSFLFKHISRSWVYVCGREYSGASAHTFSYNKSNESIYSAVENSILCLFEAKKKKKIFLCSFVNALEAPRNTHSLIHSPHCGCASRRASLVVICFQYDVLLNLSALTLFYNVIFICC